MITATIDGKTVDRAAVLRWEDRRLKAVCRTLGLPRGSAREALLEHKIRLGHAGLRAIIGRGLWIAEMTTRVTAWLSRGGRRFSVCELHVTTGSAEHFARWFDDRNNLDDERAMLAACPDHYIISRDDQGRQLVVETTGGSPFPGEFTVDYQDLSSLRSPVDPVYPIQVAGVARLADGLAIGGVRHQFRQEGEGFRTLHVVEFPSVLPGWMIAQHRWHLAVEFSNWIEAAARAD